MTSDPAKRTVFVRSLHREVNGATLHELFMQAGPVEDVSMKENFAFVTFEDEESVPYACALLNEIPLFGVYMQVKPRTGTPNAACQIPDVLPNRRAIEMIQRLSKRDGVSQFQMQRSYPPPPHYVHNNFRGSSDFHSTAGWGHGSPSVNTQFVSGPDVNARSNNQFLDQFVNSSREKRSHPDPRNNAPERESSAISEENQQRSRSPFDWNRSNWRHGEQSYHDGGNRPDHHQFSRNELHDAPHHHQHQHHHSRRYSVHNEDYSPSNRQQQSKITQQHYVDDVPNLQQSFTARHHSIDGSHSRHHHHHHHGHSSDHSHSRRHDQDSGLSRQNSFSDWYSQPHNHRIDHARYRQHELDRDFSHHHSTNNRYSQDHHKPTQERESVCADVYRPAGSGPSRSSGNYHRESSRDSTHCHTDGHFKQFFPYR